MPVHAEFYCKGGPNGKRPGVGGRTKPGGGGVTGLPVRPRWSWEWQDDFEDGDIDDTWEGWDLTAGMVKSCTVNGKTHKYAHQVLWENAEHLKKITMEMDFLFKTARINAWYGSNAFCDIGFRKTSTKVDKIYLKERILQDTKILELSLNSGTNTGYQEVLDYTEEDDEKWLILGTVKIQADYITKKAKVSGLISGEVDINSEVNCVYKTRVLGATTLHTYGGGAQNFGIAMDKLSTAAKIP